MFFRKKKDVTKVVISLDQLDLIRLGICFAESDSALESDHLDLVKTRLALGAIKRNGCGIIEVKS